MITGFNTDVKHGAKVYHVQTEDKGRNNPKIESLVYVGGEILDNYRTSYEQDKSELTEDQIMEMLENQHKRVVRYIKVGKYDEPEDFPSDVLSNRDLDEIILEYLETETSENHLKLTATGVSTLLKSNATHLEVQARTAVEHQPIPDTEVRVKIVSPGAKPLLLGKGQTGEAGTLALDITLPENNTGECALVIQGISEHGTAEKKYPLRKS